MKNFKALSRYFRAPSIPLNKNYRIFILIFKNFLYFLSLQFLLQHTFFTLSGVQDRNCFSVPFCNWPVLISTLWLYSSGIDRCTFAWSRQSTHYCHKYRATKYVSGLNRCWFAMSLIDEPIFRRGITYFDNSRMHWLMNTLMSSV